MNGGEISTGSTSFAVRVYTSSSLFHCETTNGSGHTRIAAGSAFVRRRGHPPERRLDLRLGVVAGMRVRMWISRARRGKEARETGRRVEVEKRALKGYLGSPRGGAEIDRGGGSRVQRRKLGACMR